MTLTNRIFQGVAMAALATSALGGIPARAADLPRRTEAPMAPVYAPPVFTWTGFYVGLNAGAAISDSRYQFSPFFNQNGNGGVAFTGGGQIGYNWQMGALVLGLETDLNYRGRSSNNNGATGFGGANTSTAGYFGTVRGRLGFAATDHLLIYGTGGLAYGKTNFPTTIAGIDAFGTPRAFVGSNNNGVTVGWTAGAGLEYALTPNWSIKGEYLYVDLGRKSVAYVDALSGASLTASANNRNHVVRMGLNYRF